MTPWILAIIGVTAVVFYLLGYLTGHTQKATIAETPENDPRQE